MVQCDRDLAVRLGTFNATVLPLHPDRVPPLLDEGKLIEHEQTVRPEAFAEQRVIMLLEFFLVPGTLVEEMLQRLSDIINLQYGRKRDRARNVLDGLASAGLEQTLQVDGGPLDLFAAAKTAKRVSRSSMIL